MLDVHDFASSGSIFAGLSSRPIQTSRLKPIPTFPERIYARELVELRGCGPVAYAPI
jgi:hypothetical protein